MLSVRKLSLLVLLTGIISFIFLTNIFPKSANAQISGFTVSASPTTVNTNSPITVSWTASAGQTSAQDWVAIYAQGATNEQFNDWKYTGGATSGSVQLTTPATAGTFEVRYLLNDGFTHAAVSNPITVTAPSGSFIENLATQVLATNGYLGGATSPAAVSPQFGNNKIFLSYLTNNTTSNGPRDIMAKMYDYATGQWTTSLVASIPHTGNDGHNAPSIHMTPQGHLEVYYGSIACGFSSYNPLTLDSRGGPCYKRSTSPYSISTWGAEQRVPIPGGLDAQRGGFTPDDTIHLFGPVNNGMGYIRRTSSGTWSPLYLLVYAGLGSAVGTPGAMYDTQIIGSTIHVTWSTYNGSGTGRGIYYIKSSDGGVTWTNVNGTASFLAANGLQPTGYVLDPSWHSTLGYPEWPSAYRIRTGAVASQPQVDVLPDGAIGVAETGDGGFKLQKWTGSAWQATTIHSDRPTDIELNTLNNGNITVHTTSLNTSNVYEYISTNNGASWLQTQVYQKGGEWRNGGLGSVLGSPPGQKQRVILQWNKFLEFPDRNEIAVLDRPLGNVVPLPTPTPTLAPTACHSLDSTQASPQGYAASYNPFTAQKELLMSAQCNTSTTTVTIGNGNMGSLTNWDGRMWVWSHGYQLLNNTWQPVTYTCTGEQLPVSGGTWCRAEATGTLDSQSTAYLGYTCQWHGPTQSYKCGCQDTACSTPLWHLQYVQQ